MTTLNVTLTNDLLQEFKTTSSDGGYASLYEVYFDTTSTVGIIQTLASGGTVDDGTISGLGSVVAVALPDTIPSGKIYFVVESGTLDLSSVIDNQANISSTTALADNFGYDSVELNLTGTSTDAGNLTSVNEFGLPMSVGVTYANGSTGSVGYDTSAESLVNALTGTTASSGSITGGTTIYPNSTLSTYTSGALTGDFQQLQPPSNPSDWGDYVLSLEGPQAGKVILSGQFNGAEDALNTYHNGGYFAYQLSWVENSGGTLGDGNGTFWLDPLANSQIKGDIQITPTELEDSIYQTNGDAQIYSTDTTVPAITINTGANDQWGSVLRDFVLGFDAGYFGSVGKSVNSQDTATTIDLNNSENWDPTYAFGGSLISHPTFSQWFNTYASVFNSYSNSYGFGYSDLLTAADKTGPLLSLVEPGTSTDVQTIGVTIFGYGETPTGYTAPIIGNIITPSSGGYAVAAGTSTNNIVLTFMSAQTSTNAGVVLDKNATITLNVMTSDTGGHPVWQPVTFDGGGAAAGSDGLWQQWEIIETSSTLGVTYTAIPDLLGTTTSHQAEPDGTMLINGFPVAANGGISWYQVTESGTISGTTLATSKTFDLYLTTNAQGEFLNPGYSGQTADAAVDGLGIVQGTGGTTIPQYVNTLTYDLAGSSGNATDPFLNVNNTDPNYINQHMVPVFAPVAGTMSGSMFEAVPGQTMNTTNTITTNSENLTFGWTGDNNSAGASTTSWITGPTNKINAGDYAVVTVKSIDGGNTYVTSGTAGIDGTWSTGTIANIAAGTYDVTMQEYLPDGNTYSTFISPPSDVLVLTETNESLCYLRGTRIATPMGETPIEKLNIGDVVVTRFGGQRKIKWIGRQSYRARFLAKNPAKMPVRFAAGALGEALPKRDLMVSPGHSMLLGGTLVLAKSLVNGITITQQPPTDDLHYYQIEFQSHDCVLAEGVWSESYADGPGLRNQFHNAAEFRNLYPEYTAPDELSLCAPRPQQGRVHEAALRPVLARAALGTAPGPLRGFIDLLDENGAMEGWAQDEARPQLPVALEIMWKNQVIATVLACRYRDDLAAAGIGNGQCHFSVNLGRRLTPAMRRALVIRRAEDHAKIPMTGACMARSAA